MLDRGEFLRREITVRKDDHTAFYVVSQGRWAAVVCEDHVVLEANPFQFVLS